MHSLNSTPLFKELNRLSSEQSAKIHGEHALWGLKELSFVNSSDQEHAIQVQKNILFLDEFEKINLEFYRKTNSFLTPLKGLSLQTELYGKTLSRPMTDMDVYTQLPEEVFTRILQGLGYRFQSEKKWYFNKHKFLFKKQHSLLEFTCEVHTELVPRGKPLAWITDQRGRLAKDEEFLYLCYHWGEQHTCLKLFWLFDLYFYKLKYPLDSKILLQKAEKLEITSSLLAAHWALHNCFQIQLLKNLPANFGWKSFLFKKILTPQTLANIHNKRATYLLLKHLMKDRLYKQLVYNFLWFRHKYF